MWTRPLLFQSKFSAHHWSAGATQSGYRNRPQVTTEGKQEATNVMNPLLLLPVLTAAVHVHVHVMFMFKFGGPCGPPIHVPWQCICCSFRTARRSVVGSDTTLHYGMSRVRDPVR
jgi:hypothetical protein